MNKILSFLLVLTGHILVAQHWQYYNPTFNIDLNSIYILGPGAIAAGGGQESNDSFQIMFHTDDYGQTWVENEHDGYAPWNKSIAFADPLNGFGAGNDGRIIQTNDGGLHWGFAVTPYNRDWNKIVNVNPLTYFIAGGNRSNDSIQSIVKTTDGGASWTMVYDQTGPWLKSVYFTDTLNGIAVGDSGVIIKTTNGGSVWTPVTSPIQRDFNGITFLNADTGFIVGGNTNHRTILRTGDAGLNWTVVSDVTGGILNDISFADSTTAYAVGDSATVLKTTDGGINWLPQVIDNTLHGNEQIRAVNFYDRNFGAIAGKGGLLYVYLGSPLPFSTFHTEQVTNQTYTSATLNGTVNHATVPMNLFFEYDTTILFTHSVQAIPSSVNDTSLHYVTASVNSLQALTVYYYRLKGVSGATTYYGNTLSFYTEAQFVGNTFETKTAENVNATSATLNGSINNFYFSTPVQVSFQYGTSTSLSHEVTVGPVAVNDTLFHPVSAPITGLATDTVEYYYRLKVIAGVDTFFGDTRKLYTGAPEIPNWDFEFWRHIGPQPVPHDWITFGNTGQAVSYNGSNALYLYGTSNSQPGGYAGHGVFFPQSIIGGVPFTERADSIIFYASYNIQPGDTAFALLILKQNGIPLAVNRNPITGNSGGGFLRTSYPVIYQNTGIPDTIVVAFVSSNFFMGNLNPQSWLKVDDLSFSPALQNVGDPGFESWDTLQYDQPDLWATALITEPIPINRLPFIPITRTTDAHHGAYAIRFQNIAQLVVDGISTPVKNFIKTTFNRGPTGPSFAVNRRCQNMNGYFKYLPQGDTMNFQVIMFKNGQWVGAGGLDVSDTVNVYTAFDIPINYQDSTVIPDSATIEVHLTSEIAHGNSAVYLDDLGFDGFSGTDAINVSVPEIQHLLPDNTSLFIYPNPSSEMVVVQVSDNIKQAGVIQIFNVNGQLRKNLTMPAGESKAFFSVADLESGFYFLRMRSGNKIYNRKIVVAK